MSQRADRTGPAVVAPVGLVGFTFPPNSASKPQPRGEQERNSMPIGRVPLPSLVALLLIAHQPKWTQFVSRPDGFMVLMPGRPTFQRATAPSVSGATRVGTWRLQLNDGAEYGVVYADLPADSERTPPDVLLDGARDGQLRHTKGKLLTERALVLHGHPGREETVKTTWGVYTCRILLVRRRLFQVLAATPDSTAYTRDRGRFLNSFRLLGD
jgi:hypothetical protein